MVKVTIVRPNSTCDEEKKAFENIAYALEQIVAKEYGKRSSLN